jgi:hypothetical protein
MNQAGLAGLLLSLPADAPYYNWAFGTQSWEQQPSVSMRLSKGLSDPAFIWNAVTRHAAAGLTLPDGWPVEALRIYRHFSDLNAMDESVLFAERLYLPSNQGPRDLMRALLSCDDGTNELIGDRFQCEIDDTRLFHESCWNVRDRKDEPLYRARLLRATRLAAESGLEQAVFGAHLLTLATERGEAQLVLEAAGVSADGANQTSTGMLSGQIERELLMLANSQLAKGRTNPGQNRALALLLKYLWPSEALAPSVHNDSCFGFQFESADLQLLIDDAMRRLQIDPKTNEQTANPESLAPSLEDLLKANQDNNQNSPTRPGAGTEGGHLL